MRRAQNSLLSTTAMVVLAVGASGFWGASAASAQSVDEAGALGIEQAIPGFIERMLADAPDAAFSFAGEIDATPSGSNYALAIPELTVDIARDFRLIVPSVDAVVTPLENGWLKSEWAFPTSATLMNPGGSERLDFTFIGAQNEITYAPEYSLALDGDVAITNIAATAADTPIDLSIDSLSMVVESQEETSAPHTYSSQTQMEMAGFSLDVPEENVAVAFEAITISGSSEDQRLDLFSILDQRTRGLNSQSEEFAQAFLGVVQEYKDENWIGNAEFNGSIENVSFNSPDGAGSLDSFSFSMDAENLAEETSDFGMVLEIDGVASPMLPPPFAPIVPSYAALDLNAQSAPLQDILAIVYEALGEPVPEEDRMGPKGLRAGTSGIDLNALANLDPQQFLAVLLNSDAVVEIVDLTVEAPVGYIQASGLVEPNPQAVFQAVGELSLTILGLDDMIAFSQQLGGDAAQGAAFASVIAAMGRDENDDEGNDVKVFDLEVTPAGQVFLNGNDMSAIMGMFQ